MPHTRTGGDDGPPAENAGPPADDAGPLAEDAGPEAGECANVSASQVAPPKTITTAAKKATSLPLPRIVLMPGSCLQPMARAVMQPG